MASWSVDSVGIGANYGAVDKQSSVSWLLEGSEHTRSGRRSEHGSKRVKEKKPRRLWWIPFVSAAVFALVFVSAFWHVDESQRFESVPGISERFEYIVVGGGPSGILAATRLAQYLLQENPTSAGRVLLLESGTSSQAAVLKNLKKTSQEMLQLGGIGVMLWDDDGVQINKYDVPLLWGGMTSPRIQPNSDDGPWSSNHWPIKKTLMAKGLGGAGLHNAMIYVRSLPSDIDGWNVKGWSWDDILPYYVHLEHYVDTSFNATLLPEHLPRWRGTDGILRTAPSGPSLDAVAPLFVESALNSGWPEASPGFNAPDPAGRIGAGHYEFNIRNGVRDSVAEALLGEMSAPENLVIRTGATALKALMKRRKADEKPSATGVEYCKRELGQPGDRHRALLSVSGGQVLLAAGAIMTPQLLANSGIGNGGSVAHVPGVGQNLQDHPVVAVAFRLNPELAEQASSLYTLASEIEEYFVSVKRCRSLDTARRSNVTRAEWKQCMARIGTLGTAGFSAGAFLTSPWASDGIPDIQLTVFPRIVEPHVRRRDVNRHQDGPNGGQEYVLSSKSMLVTVALLTPEARYMVHPFRPEQEGFDASDLKPPGESYGGAFYNYSLPVIELPSDRTTYLSKMDVRRLAWGVEEVRRIQTFPPLSDMTGEEIYPKVKGSALKQYIREHHLPNSHWVGSTKMGSLEEDPMAVVDERLHVRGVEQLRIVDAGVLPKVPNGNTHSTVCVVASRAADLIWEDRVRSRSVLE